MKKVIIIVTSIIILLAAAFAGTSYYLNNPDMVIANAFSSSSRGSSYNGNVDLKINFDTSKIMNLPGIADNAFAQSEIQGIKDTLEASTIKLSLKGESENKKALMNINFTLPEALGQPSSVSTYTENNNAWIKIGDGNWTKSSSGNTSVSPEDEKSSTDGALKFLKKCPIKEDGDKLLITMNPKYDDIKELIPSSVLNEVNKESAGGLTLETIFNALSINAIITVDKNSSFFIPHPFISKTDINMKGDLSKIVSNIKDIPEDQKVIFEGISFTASGTLNSEKKDNMYIVKPDGIQ